MPSHEAELKNTTSECVGKTNSKLEVKCSDCAPGKIPELAANAQLPFLLWKERKKMNAERGGGRVKEEQS